MRDRWSPKARKRWNRTRLTGQLIHASLRRRPRATVNAEPIALYAVNYEPLLESHRRVRCALERLPRSVGLPQHHANRRTLRRHAILALTLFTMSSGGPVAALAAPSPNGRVIVYVVDSGVRATHRLLAGHVSSGFTVIDDGRGTDDCLGHGTHVAGTILDAAQRREASVTIVPVRVMDCKGSGTDTGLVSGLDWIVAQQVGRFAGIPAIANLSLELRADRKVDAAVRRATSAGIIVDVAAGNDEIGRAHV